MAFSTSSGSSVRGLSALAEINITPLVDVMLVLLIVFMVSAPLMQQGLQVDLPKANAGSLSEAPEQLVLVINKNRQVMINGNVVPAGGLKPKLEAIATARPDVQVFIQGDQSVPYGVIAQVMAEVKRSKVTRVGLVTEPGDNESHF